MAVFIEFLVGSALAIFFHQVLHYEEAAYIIFGIGILLSLVTYLLKEDIDKTRSGLLAQYHQVHEIPFALAQITDPDCQVKAQDVIQNTKKTLALLQQGYIPLDKTESSLERAKLADQTTHSIKAVLPMTANWVTSGLLLIANQANLRALDRGVRITRNFVVTREDLANPEVQKVLLAQYQDDIEVRITYAERLPTVGDIIGRDSSNSIVFTIYDERVVIDALVQPGKYFGRKTSQPAEVAKYLHLYELIEHSAQPLLVEDDKIILPSDAVAVALAVAS
ncbi:MAG: hypothetical protein ACYDAI_01015 [Trichloromonadaceae bacterium]